MHRCAVCGRRVRAARILVSGRAGALAVPLVTVAMDRCRPAHNGATTPGWPPPAPTTAATNCPHRAEARVPGKCAHERPMLVIGSCVEDGVVG